MRPIHVVTLDKPRPAVLLTRPEVLDCRAWVSIAPITSTVRGLSVEVPVGPANGIDHPSVVNCDDINTVHRDDVGRLLGYLRDDQEPQLAEAIVAAFALDL
ncbi:type II toxin-antitoxin system PemK/MazF family toxin [Microlunatus antarcticus]|uniref:mRNA interferase MazF n=1 Tax=Microlunatus antarcticus TaxID=53388 RepID=A0A7W5P7F0_9ACTN|nr:type II toxin-antitoxin system PemK/MazF family toxin [Microlunatus antarcticus]MBB3326781.1 mRNA interferase MazF [Microlunatus antarcticus]